MKMAQDLFKDTFPQVHSRCPIHNFPMACIIKVTKNVRKVRFLVLNIQEMKLFLFGYVPLPHLQVYNFVHKCIYTYWILYQSFMS